MSFRTACLSWYLKTEVKLIVGNAVKNINFLQWEFGPVADHHFQAVVLDVPISLEDVLGVVIKVKLQ